MTLLRPFFVLFSAGLCVLQGCSSRSIPSRSIAHPSPLPFSATIEYPDVGARSANEAAVQTLPPRTLDDEAPAEYWDLTLEEAVRIALTNNSVLKDLGGQVVSAPQGLATVFDPAIRDSDPLYGTEGALSLFDPQLTTGMFWSKNDRALNNILLGGGVRELEQDLATFDTAVSKTAATGTQFSVRSFTTYDANNAPGNLFPSAWDSQLETTVRQPLLQGAGVQFNRIAGPNAQPGFYFSSGVLIARTNTDISLAEFESGVVEFLSEVEDAYWELYFAYRELDAKIAVRNTALETWRQIHAKFSQDLPGAEAEKESQAREQFLRLEDEVQSALNGSAASRSVGVYRGERHLRYMLGLALNDGRLIRPSDEPPQARVAYEWNNVLSEALVRRVELRSQKWRIKRRELELIAARSFLLPRLDAVATYRLRGFGDVLTGSDAAGRFSSALDDLGSRDHQEWQVGMQLNVPLGMRRGAAAVRNAELQLVRERAVLSEQELKVAHELGDAYAEANRSHGSMRTRFNRVQAASQNQTATQAAFEGDRISVDLLLASQERLADAELAYHRATVDYAKAVKNIHRQKGSLLELNGVQLNEGPWPLQAHRDANRLAAKLRPSNIDYRMTRPRNISMGAVEQDWDTVEHLRDDFSPDTRPASDAKHDELTEIPSFEFREDLDLSRSRRMGDRTEAAFATAHDYPGDEAKAPTSSSSMP